MLVRSSLFWAWIQGYSLWKKSPPASPKGRLQLITCSATVTEFLSSIRCGHLCARFQSENLRGLWHFRHTNAILDDNLTDLFFFYFLYFAAKTACPAVLCGMPAYICKARAVWIFSFFTFMQQHTYTHISRIRYFCHSVSSYINILCREGKVRDKSSLLVLKYETLSLQPSKTYFRGLERIPSFA